MLLTKPLAAEVCHQVEDMLHEPPTAVSKVVRDRLVDPPGEVIIRDWVAAEFDDAGRLAAKFLVGNTISPVV